MLDWITGFIGSVGLLGVALLMFLENVFPPIPSELIMPLAGFEAAQGNLNLVLVILAGTVGSLAGATLWYWIGLKIGTKRLKAMARRRGRLLTITPDEIDTADAWFDNHGGKAVLVGRLIPTVRTFISVPAGVSEMRLARFLIFSGIGTAAWTTLLALAGFLLESQYEKVSGWLNPVSTAVLVGVMAWYLWRVATFRRKVPKHQAGE
jgi:membrane protein DedA with SNARE-associated domain